MLQTTQAAEELLPGARVVEPKGQGRHAALGDTSEPPALYVPFAQVAQVAPPVPGRQIATAGRQARQGGRGSEANG